MKILCSFLVLALVGLEVHGVALGADRCTWGPSYWCKNYGTAKTCGSVEHCKTNYWNKPVKNDEICNLCKEGMTVVDNYLKANATKAAIEAELLQICSDIPIPDLSTQCKQLITENFDMIYDEGLILVGNGDMVCTLIGLCTSSVSEGDVVKQMVDNLPNIVRKAMENNELPIASPFIAPVPIFNQAPQQNAEGDCSDCQAFIKDVQNAIMNDPNMVKSWTGLMQTECDALGPGLSEICMQRSHEAINDIARYHMSDADAMSVCNTIKMCGFKSQKTVDNDMCTDCTRFFSDWKEMMMNNKTLVNSIIAEMSDLYCLQKPANLRKQCARYVSMVIETMLNRIEQEPPTAICKTIYFCQDDAQTLQQNMIAALFKKLPRNVGNAKYCTDCTNYMKDLQDVAANNKSIIASLTELIKEQCNTFEPIIADLCKAQVPSAIANLLPQFEALDVNTICSTIMMCPATSPAHLLTGDLCTDCTAFFSDWQEIIQNNKSVIVNFAKQIGNGYCKQMPDIFQSECNNAIDGAIVKYLNLITTQCDMFTKEYLPQLWDLIQYNDAGVICSTLYMCEGQFKRIVAAKPVAVAKSPVKAENPVTCALCHVVIHELDKMLLGNKTSAAVIKALDEVCSILPLDIRSECKQFVDSYGKTIVDLIVHEVESGAICSMLLLCSAEDNVKKVTDSTTCELCELVATQLDNLLKKNSTEAEIIAAVEKVCTILPSNVQVECRQLIDQYGSMIINLLAQEVTPAELCGAIKLCTSLKVSDSTTCELCELVATQLDNLLKKNSTEAEIIAAVEKVCTILPSSVQVECRQLIDQYGSMIINLLAQEVTPAELCGAIKLCTSLKVSDSTVCDLCKLVAGELDNLLTNNSTEAEIVAAVEKVCTILPSSVQVECRQLIDQYGSVIINLLAQEVTPSKLCDALGLCTSFKVKETKVKSDITCELCTVVMQQVDKLLGENSTETEIIAALDKVCMIIPGELKPQCVSFINDNAPMIIQLLLEQIAPSKVCAELKLCTSSAATLKSSNGELCDVCKLVIQFVDQQIGSNATSKEVETALDQICAQLPASFKQTCDDFVMQYTPEILKMLDNIADPDYICLHLDLCPGKAAHQTLIGANPCTFGPSYWCKNQQTAVECNAVSHCEKHVWE